MHLAANRSPKKYGYLRLKDRLSTAYPQTLTYLYTILTFLDNRGFRIVGVNYPHSNEGFKMNKFTSARLAQMHAARAAKLAFMRAMVAQLRPDLAQ